MEALEIVSHSSPGEGRLEASRLIAENVKFRFIAQELGRTASGLHARMTLALNSTILAWDYGNIQRSTWRDHLANKAHRLLDNDFKLLYPSTDLQHDFDMFCLPEKLWTTHLRQYTARPTVSTAEPEPIRFVIEPYVLEEGGTILFGPPGRGKSCVALLKAVSVDSGSCELFNCVQLNTLYVNLERSARSIIQRLGRVNTILRWPRTRPLLFLHARGQSLQAIKDIVAESIKQHDVRFLVLDSISRAGMGDLTQNEPANRITDILNSLCPTWLAIAHTPRQDETHVYGGIHFDAGADIMVRLLSQQGDTDLGIGLQITKANDLPKQPVRCYSFEFDEYGLFTARHASIADYPLIRAGRTVSPAEQIEEYLLDNGPSTVEQIAKALERSRNYINAIVVADKHRFTTLGKEGRALLYAPRARLFTG